MLALMLAILAAGRPLPPVTRAEARGIAADLADATSDSAVIAGNPGGARREGRTLSIGDTRLVDQGAACDGSGCERFRFDRPWFAGQAGVKVADDENEDYLLVDTRGQRFTYVGARPHPSPSGRLFLTGIGNELDDRSIGGLPDGIYLWRSRDLARIRTVDDARIHYTRFVDWHGDRCVEFAGRADRALGTPERHYWLVEEPQDWTLHDQPPPACT